MQNNPYSIIPISPIFQNLKECTIEVWFKLDSSAVEYGKFIIMRYGTDVPLATIFARHVYGEDSIVVHGDFFPDNSLNPMTRLTSKAIKINTWYKVTFTYDGKTEKLYLNDKLQDESTENLNLANPTGSIWLGKNGLAYKPKYFRGIIDEIRISNIARIPNTTPIAIAGKDTVVEANSPDGVEFTLDGSQSYDLDGNTLTYQWYLNGSQIANGVNPSVNLPFGENNVVLIVNDGYVDSQPDTVLINVVDTTPPIITASLDTIKYHGHHVTYLIKYSATDLCDPDPYISGVIKLPDMTDPELKFKEKKKSKIKVDLNKNKVTVENESPEEFWAKIIDDGGISVQDQQQIEMEFKKEDDKYEYEFDDLDNLEEVEGHQITLYCTSSDKFGNTSISEVTITYSNEDDEKESETLANSDPIESVKTGNKVPQKHFLYQNYPNPFNPTTNIKFSLPNTEFVKILIYNSSGEIIKTLFQGTLNSGTYIKTWDGKDDSGNSVTSGIYFCKLISGKFVQINKMILIR